MLQLVHSECFDGDFKWHVTAHGKEVITAQCCAFKSLPLKIHTPTLLKKLIDTVDSLQVCAGHPDQLLDMAMNIFGISLHVVDLYWCKSCMVCAF